MGEWQKLKEAAMGYDCPEKDLAWGKIEKFIEAALEVDNLKMSMAREDIDRRIFEYNKAKRVLLE